MPDDTTIAAEATPPPPAGAPPRKPTGKIAELPRAQRDMINLMLADGKTYKAVATEMAKHGISLNGENVSNWYDSGFQHYLRHRDWLTDIATMRENADDILEGYDPLKFHQAVNHVAVSQIFKSLRDEKLTNDPLSHTRALNALSRLSREALVFKKYEDARSDAQARELAQCDPNRVIDRNAIFAATERALGFAASPGPIGPDLNEYFARSSRGDEAQSSTDPAPQTDPEPGKDAFHSVPDPCNSPSPNIDRSPIQESKSPSISPVAQIKHQKSKNKNTMNPSLQHSSPAASTPSVMDGINPSGSVAPQESTNPAIQQSTRPVELCRDCSTPLPSLLPNGTRPHRRCPGCDVLLHPPGSTFDRCQFCDAAQALIGDNERLTDFCARCNNVLPPPGRRFLTHCPGCGLDVGGPTSGGSRVITRCPDCRANLPLLEPPSPASPKSDEGGSSFPPGGAGADSTAPLPVSV
jgi:hypothetical protein